MEFILFVALVLAFAAFRQWLVHRRRQMLHIERLTAMDKGLSIPPLEAEPPSQNGWNVQRILLLAGLIWISLGVTYLVMMSVFIANPTPRMTEDIPNGVQWIGLAPILIGLSHLIVFWVGKKREEIPSRPGFSTGYRTGLPTSPPPPAAPPMERMEPRQTV
jgi:hypothetical protein